MTGHGRELTEHAGGRTRYKACMTKACSGKRQRRKEAAREDAGRRQGIQTRNGIRKEREKGGKMVRQSGEEATALGGDGRFKDGGVYGRQATAWETLPEERPRSAVGFLLSPPPAFFVNCGSIRPTVLVPLPDMPKAAVESSAGPSMILDGRSLGKKDGDGRGRAKAQGKRKAMARDGGRPGERRTATAGDGRRPGEGTARGPGRDRGRENGRSMARDGQGLGGLTALALRVP